MKKILFVCTGNTCRSPMAQGLFSVMAREAGIEAEVRSAGIAAVDGMSVSRHAADILQKQGFEEELSSRKLTEEDVRWADLILTMTMNHKGSILRQFPEALDKTWTLKEFAAEEDPPAEESEQERLQDVMIKLLTGEQLNKEEQALWKTYEEKLMRYDVADPFGGDRDMYERTAEEIRQALEKVIRKLRDEARD
jgi:protein-tyrosine phosphatase